MATNSYDDLEVVTKLIELILSVCGTNIFNVNYTEKKWRKHVRMIPTILIALAPICALRALYYNKDDYARAVEAVFAIAATVHISSKSWIIHGVREDIVKFIDKCRTFRRNHADDIKEACDVFKINRLIARPSFVIKIFSLLYFISVTVFFSAPFLRTDQSLPLSVYLPIGPPFVTPFYEVNFAYLGIYLIFSSVILLGIDAVLLCFLLEICLQMNVIKYKLSTLGDDEEDDQQYKLREIYQLHWNISNLVKNMNSIFSKLLMAQFSTSFLLISTSLFMITKHYTNFIYALVLEIIQLGLYCLSGEVIKDMFEKLLYTLYDNQWYKLNSSEKKSLITMMSYAQAPPSLKALGYIELSLETYFQVLKAAYTYLAVMQNIQPEE